MNTGSDLIQTIILAPALTVRAGLRVMLETAGDFEIVAEAASLAELGPLHQPVDVILIQPAAGETFSSYDDSVPSDAAVLSISDEPGQAAVLASGMQRAWGVLPTDCSQEELLAALYTLDLGLVVALPERIASLMSVRIQSGTMDEYIPDLTERELEVLDLLAEGFANKQISLELGISENTVKFHVSSIYSKLNVSNRAEAVRLGIQMGLIVI